MVGDELTPSSGRSRQEPLATADAAARVWTRLQEQLTWYDRRARESQRWYRGLKLMQLVAAALVPVAAGLHAAAWITGALGSAVVLVEGVQQLFQFQERWITYRSTWAALRNEQYRYETRIGDYATAPAPPALLAERLQAVVAEEHVRWIALHEQGAPAKR